VIRTVNPAGTRTYPGMSHAVRADRLMFLSGQVAVDAAGTVVAEGDAAGQARQCFGNIEAVLRAEGGSLADVVHLTCYLADAAAYPAYAGVKAELFAQRAPAGTAVVVAALLDHRFLLEIEAIAVLDPRESS
jgi:2-iminobutanoate/2-iminopropanoate deaminase